MKIPSLIIICLALALTSCKGQSQDEHRKTASTENPAPPPILPGASSFDQVVKRLQGKRVGVVANHTALINGVHLVDSLLNAEVDVIKVFAPEHGFRGDVPDGDLIKNSTDNKTGLPIVSLYGKSKKPSPEVLEDIDVIVFDIQDVGVRFFTYLSTLHYVMEAAAEQGISVVILDRPNPNGFYVDGPVLKPEFTAFIGLHPVPIVYGMTIGEYGQMINGESWLKNGVKCSLEVIPCENYTHSSYYQLPVKPSPNLPDMKAIYWYPSICLFEGTSVSIGRGTPEPFTRIGVPNNQGGNFTFTPEPVEGASLNPKHKGELCIGYNLIDSLNYNDLPQELNLYWLFRMYKESPDRQDFFRKDGYFDLLAGTDELRKSLISSESIEAVRKSWEGDLEAFKKVRVKYLIYPE